MDGVQRMRGAFFASSASSRPTFTSVTDELCVSSPTAAPAPSSPPHTHHHPPHGPVCLPVCLPSGLGHAAARAGALGGALRRVQGALRVAARALGRRGLGRSDRRASERERGCGTHKERWPPSSHQGKRSHGHTRCTGTTREVGSSRERDDVARVRRWPPSSHSESHGRTRCALGRARGVRHVLSSHACPVGDDAVVTVGRW